MSSFFNKITTILLILFCPFVFAEGAGAEGTADLIAAVFGFGLVAVYFIFAIFVLVLFFKKWNQTNKILENINKSIEDIKK